MFLFVLNKLRSLKHDLSAINDIHALLHRLSFYFAALQVWWNFINIVLLRATCSSWSDIGRPLSPDDELELTLV